MAVAGGPDVDVLDLVLERRVLERVGELPVELEGVVDVPVGEGAGTTRRVLVGGAIGVGCAAIGTVVFWFLLNGLRGA